MDRERLLEHLRKAETQVIFGARHLAQQRALVFELSPDNPIAEKARDLLRTFEGLQERHVALRDRLLAEIYRLDCEQAETDNRKGQ